MKLSNLLLMYLFMLTLTGFLNMSTAYGQTTLKHSYTFEDGTANDVAGTANGALVGDAAVANGKLTLSGNGFVGLPGKDINLAQYESITVEAVFSQASTTGGFSMLYSFGRTNLDPGWPMGVDYFFYQPTRKDDNDCRAAICCLNYDNPWTTESLINSPKIADTDKHYVVTIVTATEMSLYIDGAFRGTVTLDGNNVLANISNDTAYIGASIYTNDNKWKGSVYEMNIYSGVMNATTIVERAEEFLKIPVANATLSNIASDKGDLSPAFASETSQYDLNLEYGTSQINLKAIPTVNGATVKMYDGLDNLISDGVVTITGDGVDVKIKVTALNGFSEQTYSVSTYYYPEDEAASLAGISLSAGSLVGEFESDITEYTAIVPYGTKTVNITCIPLWQNEKIEGDGTITLTDGVGMANIVVTSENGENTKVYTIKIAASKVTTGKYYYLVHEKSGLVATESLEGYDVLKLSYPLLEESTQIFEFVASGVANQYFIKNLVPSYLTHSMSNTYDMLLSPELSDYLDSNRFVLNEFEAGRFRIESVIKNGADGRFMGTNDGNLNAWIFNDKWSDNSLAIWNILTPEEVVDPYDTYLSELTIDQVALSPDFEMHTTDYYVTLPVGTTSIDISALANDASSTITGTGTIEVSSNGGVATITVTASDPEFTRNYTIHYILDTPLTLKHSYTFADGTAQDQVGDADGAIIGGSVTSGVYSTKSQGEYIKLPASKIAINSYPSITIEAYVMTGENPGCTMFAYFGGLSGVNTYWLTIAGCNDFSKAVINEGSEYGAEGVEAAAGENHHYVSTLTNDSISLYIDGVLAAKGPIGGNYTINKLSLENAFLCKSGYNDPTWIGSIYEFNIYSGEMDAQTIAEHAANFPAEDELSDATLSDLQVDGNTIKDFDPAVLNYTLTVANGTTVVPTVTVTPKYANSTAVVTKASTIPGTTRVVVTAQDGSTKNTYTVAIKFPATHVATLSDLTVDGTTISGFDPATKLYTVNLTEIPTAIPTIGATSSDANAAVAISQAITVPGTAKVIVTAEDQVSKATYFVSYIITSGVNENQGAQIEVYPTIFSDNFVVKTNGNVATVTVYDINGRVALSQNNVYDEVTLRVQNPGLYLVKVAIGNQTQTFKVIKTN